MIRLSILVLVLGFGMTIGACSKDKEAGGPTGAPSQVTEPSKKTSAHAPTDVKPGSYEDWCGEHAVPESQCTLCNPSLAAAFKATGDWCNEHGLPESQCKKCNPSLKIVRPPKTN